MAWGLALTPPRAWAADILVQAENAGTENADPAPAHALICEGDAVGGWAVIHASGSPGFPNAPGRLRFDPARLPEEPYRPWARMARWAGTEDTVPNAHVTFGDSAGHDCRYELPTAGGPAEATCFRGRPGGVFGREGEWFWLALFELDAIPDACQVTVTADPGQLGTGNYKGIWVDASRLEDLSHRHWPDLDGDETMAGQWRGSPWLSRDAPKEGALALAFPGRAQGEVARLYLPPEREG